MIRWIKNYIGTASAKDIKRIQKEHPDIFILDVRVLLDGSGNSPKVIREKIDEGLKALQSGKKIVVVCDQGVSRSNSIAAGIISSFERISFDEALKIVYKETKETEIKIEVIESVREAVEGKKTEKTSSFVRLAITGANGFIGKRLVQKLRENSKIDFFPITRNDLDLMKDKILLDIFIKENQINTLLHLANPKNYTSNSSLGETLTMLKNVLDVCSTNNVYLIYPSGWVIFSGYKGEELSVDENFAPKPKDTYSYTKFLAEQLVTHWYSDIQYCILRICPVYGEGSDKPKFIWNFIEYASENKDIGVHRYKNGFPKLELIYVDDVCEAIIKVIEKKPKGVINIGSGKAVYVKEVAEKIIKLMNSKSKIYYIDVDDITSSITLDISKAKKILGWEPKIKIEEGLKKIIESIKSKKN
ncbi:dTDP-4-dehydro-6-deoxyglucose reductase [bacterium HR19]|nr:dTDP-4-dehydro-6-deoxyglucose reductase [bacterium HR19]